MKYPLSTLVTWFVLSIVILNSHVLVLASERKPVIVKQSFNPDKMTISQASRFTYEPDLDEQKYTYIVRLNESAMGEHAETVKLLKNSNLRLSRTAAQSFVLNKQLSKIDSQQNDFLAHARKQVPDLQIRHRYAYALNGMALTLSQSEAQTLVNHSAVMSITREKMHTINTDRGPTLIGAAKVWDGSALNTLVPSQGEGVIIGIIDSGINTDHPSFAEVSGDGYVHTNPLGDGVYLGDCAQGFPELCNNKLIGVWSFDSITREYSDTTVFPPNLPANGEDYGGHGSHVASIAAGNVLMNVNEVLPELNEIESAGVPTGFSFPQISGVAPRANIISYQVCFGGTSNRGDTYGDCPGAAILQGINQAIADQVDIINFSVSGADNPWGSIAELAFLNARNAGIFVATSAGNEGSDPSSTDKNAPWYTSVASSQHGRENVFAKALNNFSGGTSALQVINGQSNSSGITAPIVYAGDFTNPNDPGGDPAQCLAAFPANTFAGQIVVCDRGDIARVAKAENVSSGGAGGYVLANIQGGDSFLANDEYVVPGIHINADDGDALKAWLRSGTNHRATITEGMGAQAIDSALVDVLASSSSRGPNSDNSTLSPSVTAPGVNIYGAYADQQFGHDGHSPAASDFNYLSGTSMASPHVAGAAALIKSLRPEWSPDAIRAALSFTANPNVKKEDGISAADFFDMGAGRIQVDQAIASGLIMEETGLNYARANPLIEGDPRTLNLPSITDSQCAGNCTWERTFTATTNATWNVNTEAITVGLQITATPARFTLLSGQSQTVRFSINNSQVPKNIYAFARATLSSTGLPDANLPISVLSSIGDIPLFVAMNSSRGIDSLLFRNLQVFDAPTFNLTAYKPVKAIVQTGELFQDTNNNQILDDLNDGVAETKVIVRNNSKRLIAKINQSTARDLDLFLGFDRNADGVISNTEIIAQSRNSGSDEVISINYPSAGEYSIFVHNFEASNSSNADVFEMRYAVVNEVIATNDEFFVEAPTILSQQTPIELRFVHKLPNSVAGDEYFTAVDMGSISGGDDLGMISVDITRINDDISITADPARVNTGELVPFSVNIAANTSNEIRDYFITIPLPVGTQFSSFSTINNGRLINNELSWRVTKAAGDDTENRLNFNLNVLDGANAGPISVSANSVLLNQNFSDSESTEAFTNIQIEGAPLIQFNGEASGQFVVTETRSFMIPIEIIEPNNDSVNVVWTQTQGPITDIIDDSGMFSLSAPRVDTNTALMFNVTVTDINNNASSANMEVTVRNNGAPVISNISAPATALAGEGIILSISASDPENDTLTIKVNNSIISGTSTRLIAPNTAGVVSYSVVVSDGIDETSQSVSVNITQNQSEDSTNNDSGGGSMPLWSIVMLLLVVLRRADYKAMNHAA